MADIKKVNQINFDYNGKHYCLEYTRDTVKQMEAMGFSINDIGDKPATRIEQLWAGAFLANCHKTSQTTGPAFDVLDAIVDNFESFFFSDLSVADLMGMLPLVDELSGGTIENYEMSGDKIIMSMIFFASSYFDQAKRQEIIYNVYGVEVPQLKLISHSYLNYLTKYAFPAVKAVRVAGKIIEWAKENKYDGAELAEAEAALQDLIGAISEVDDKLDQAARTHVDKRLTTLKDKVHKLHQACSCTIHLTWKIEGENHWYMDPDIEQFYQIDWT